MLAFRRVLEHFCHLGFHRQIPVLVHCQCQERHEASLASLHDLVDDSMQLQDTVTFAIASMCSDFELHETC
jgi:hypothetical protein